MPCESLKRDNTEGTILKFPEPPAIIKFPWHLRRLSEPCVLLNELFRWSDSSSHRFHHLRCSQDFQEDSHEGRLGCASSILSSETSTDKTIVVRTQDLTPPISPKL